MQLLERSWQRSWQALHAVPAPDLFEQLVASYREPQRRYHTLQHLGECLGRLEPVLGLAQHAGEVEVALWFHDAIYDPRAQDNEIQSARWARQALAAVQVSGEALSRVDALIMATRHQAPPQTPDEHLLVDVDLAILGSAPVRFAKYEAQIREEYGWIPDAQFRDRRVALLAEFLGRPAIYSTEHFHRQFEAQARQNLERSLRQPDLTRKSTLISKERHRAASSH